MSRILDLIYEPWRRLCLWAFDHIPLGRLAPHVLHMGLGRNVTMKRIK